MPYALYRRLLICYQRNSNSCYAATLRVIVRWAVTALQQWQGFHFPDRAIGGWWWIERFRFEVLMGWFEHESVERVRRLVRPGMTVIDIGAHVGYYTRLLSEWVGPTGRVLAFEPNPDNFAVLQHNLAPHRYHNVELMNSAVGDRDCVLSLYVSPGNSNHSVIPGYTEAESVLSVPCVRLDSFLAERGIERVGFVKSDTEGAEPLVLAGMQRVAECSPDLHLLIEVNPAALRCGNVEPEEFLRRVRQMGFEIEAIPSDSAAKDICENILCWKTGPRKSQEACGSR